MLHVDPTIASAPRRRRRRRWPTFLAIVAAMGALGSIGVIAAAHRTVGKIDRVPEVAAALSPVRADIENYLLVGSDSRADADPNSPDFGGIGDTVTGSRSDTIMILRLDKSTGKAALLSIPRDLYVEIPGHGKDRINSAFNYGAQVLVQTVRETLQIPVQHYVEIDFSGFKSLVDAIGGVVVCFEFPTRDLNTGLNITDPGCPLLTGVEALEYARSRHFEQFHDGDWHEDGTSDLGRSTRQRDFVNRAIQGALDKVKADPFASGRLIAAISSSLHVDDSLDPLKAIDKLRSAVDGGLPSFSIPVVGKTVSGKAVLLLGDGSEAVLDYFRGISTTPPPAG